MSCNSAERFSVLCLLFHLVHCVSIVKFCIKCQLSGFLNRISQIPQFEDVKFEAASLLSELYCQQIPVNKAKIHFLLLQCLEIHFDEHVFIQV